MVFSCWHVADFEVVADPVDILPFDDILITVIISKSSLVVGVRGPFWRCPLFDFNVKGFGLCTHFCSVITVGVPFGSSQ